jgi:IS5 family transposase
VVQRTQQVVAESGGRLAGVTVRPTTRVASAPADARPLGKGRSSKPVEFGDKAHVLDGADGIRSL